MRLFQAAAPTNLNEFDLLLAKIEKHKLRPFVFIILQTIVPVLLVIVFMGLTIQAYAKLREAHKYEDRTEEILKEDESALEALVTGVRDSREKEYLKREIINREKELRQYDKRLVELKRRQRRLMELRKELKSRLDELEKAEIKLDKLKQIEKGNRLSNGNNNNSR